MNKTARTAGKTSEAKKDKADSQKQNTDLIQPANSPAEQILLLQRTIGNQAVGRLITSGSEIDPGIVSHIHSLKGSVRPLDVRAFTSGRILQRAVNYIEQVKGDEAAPYLQTFDKTVETIDKQISGTKETVADDIKQALAQLRSLRAANKITCWRVSGGLTYASFDNATGEIRLHINIGSAASSPVSLIHEAIHALHASRYPKLSKLYAEVLAAGGTTNESIGVLLLKWKAWTEYWAYRRHIEFGNLNQPPESRRDPDIAAMKEPDVRASISKVRDLTGENFNPANWSPPANTPKK